LDNVIHSVPKLKIKSPIFNPAKSDGLSGPCCYFLPDCHLVIYKKREEKDNDIKEKEKRRERQ